MQDIANNCVMHCVTAGASNIMGAHWMPLWHATHCIFFHLDTLVRAELSSSVLSKQKCHQDNHLVAERGVRKSSYTENGYKRVLLLKRGAESWTTQAPSHNSHGLDSHVTGTTDVQVAFRPGTDSGIGTCLSFGPPPDWTSCQGPAGRGAGREVGSTLACPHHPAGRCPCKGSAQDSVTRWHAAWYEMQPGRQPPGFPSDPQESKGNVQGRGSPGSNSPAST